METKQRYYPPATTRSSLMLQVASSLVAEREWRYRQAKVTLREQGGHGPEVCFFGDDSPGGIEAVGRGEVHIATVNPATVLALAARGKGPFKKPLPLRTIAVVPSLDQLGFAVSQESGLTSLYDIRKRRYPLKLSLRGQKNHSIHIVVKEVLAAVGTSIEDILAWGGRISYDEGNMDDPHGFRARVAAVKRGETDAIFDEALNLWVNLASESGMRFLSLEDSLLKELEALGLRRGTIEKAEFSKLPRDVTTIDFSGWPVYTLASAPDELITSFCRGLMESRDSIPWQGEGPLPLERMCRDTPEGPLAVPLHSAAERFWRECGYLSK